MGQKNQVYWRGIQNVDPHETVLIDTKKYTPAIADLQAIEAQVVETVSENGVSAGNNTLAGTAVPSGKMQVITSICAINLSSIITYTEIQIFDGSGAYTIDLVLAPAALQGVDVRGHFILDAGDKIRAIFSGCVDGDNIRLWINGYQIDKY